MKNKFNLILTLSFVFIFLFSFTACNKHSPEKAIILTEEECFAQFNNTINNFKAESNIKILLDRSLKSFEGDRLIDYDIKYLFEEIGVLTNRKVYLNNVTDYKEKDTTNNTILNNTIQTSDTTIKKASDNNYYLFNGFSLKKGENEVVEESYQFKDLTEQQFLSVSQDFNKLVLFDIINLDLDFIKSSPLVEIIGEKIGNEINLNIKFTVEDVFQDEVRGVIKTDVNFMIKNDQIVQITNKEQTITNKKVVSVEDEHLVKIIYNNNQITEIDENKYIYAGQY